MGSPREPLHAPKLAYRNSHKVSVLAVLGISHMAMYAAHLVSLARWVAVEDIVGVGPKCILVSHNVLQGIGAPLSPLVRWLDGGLHIATWHLCLCTMMCCLSEKF